jgi:hypothetical protein
VQLGLEADGAHGSFAVRGDGEDDGEDGFGGGAAHQVRRCAGHELPCGSGTGPKAHDQAEMVAGDVHEMALVQVLTAAPPSGSARSPGGMSAELTGATHAATIEGEGEAALDPLGAELERFFGRT